MQLSLRYETLTKINNYVCVFQALKKLIKEGRLEITAGGWVMPDEACTHIYALVDQFIEGKNKFL